MFGLRIWEKMKSYFRHRDTGSLSQQLEANIGKFDRVVVISDGVFSMLGAYQDLKKVREVMDRYDSKFPEGIFLIVDDCHGIAAFGKTGRGCEEVSGAKADALVGTLGKGFGVDGGYVVSDQVVIDYLRESAATYIYSNSITPGCAAAALKGWKFWIRMRRKMLTNLERNISLLKTELKKGFTLADSSHPIQPVLS